MRTKAILIGAAAGAAVAFANGFIPGLFVEPGMAWTHDRPGSFNNGLAWGLISLYAWGLLQS